MKSNKMAAESIKVGLSVLVITAILLVQGIESAEFSRAKVFKVANKLEAYALGTSGPSSGLTAKDLEDAYAEYKTWDPSIISRIKSNLSLDKLLIDFLLTPMDRYAQLVGESEPDGSISRQQIHFIKRLELNYKRFRPNYLGQQTGRYFTATKTDTLVRSLYQIMDPKPLTAKMFADAKNELTAYNAKLNEIVEYEDVYSNLDEFALLLNYMNRPEIGVLGPIIFPLYDSMPEPKNIEALRDRFILEMRKRKYVVENGILYNMG